VSATDANPQAHNDDRDETDETLDRNTIELLNELRIAATGIQVMFALPLLRRSRDRRRPPPVGPGHARHPREPGGGPPRSHAPGPPGAARPRADGRRRRRRLTRLPGRRGGYLRPGTIVEPLSPAAFQQGGKGCFRYRAAGHTGPQVVRAASGGG
jgi:hypothetical protein